MSMPARTSADIRDAVRRRYAEAARAAEVGPATCCGPADASCGCGTGVEGPEERQPFGAALYSREEGDSLPEAAKLASLGCGNPTAVATLSAGEVVLDLGSGGGIDVLLSARRVSPGGKAYGLDMTDEMLELAEKNRAEAGAENAQFLKGHIEDIPLPEDHVDVIISNCVINLSADKPRVFREAARVLRPGGRFAVTDVVADPQMDEATRGDLRQWTGCIAGALTEEDFRRQLAAAGLEGIEIRQTHRIHEHAGSAIVRARKP
jgi:arsenite methyltransferase